MGFYQKLQETLARVPEAERLHKLPKADKIPYFLSIHDSVPDKVFWGMLKVAYITGWPGPYRERFRELFFSDRPGREWLMNEYEQRLHDEMPDKVDVFRVLHIYEILTNDFGLSWTMREQSAKDFQRGAYRERADNLITVSVTVPKEAIICRWVIYDELIIAHRMNITYDPDVILSTIGDAADADQAMLLHVMYHKQQQRKEGSEAARVFNEAIEYLKQRPDYDKVDQYAVYSWAVSYALFHDVPEPEGAAGDKFRANLTHINEEAARLGLNEYPCYACNKEGVGS